MAPVARVGDGAPLASQEDLSGSALGTPRTLPRQPASSPAERTRDPAKRIYDRMRLTDAEEQQLQLQEPPLDT